MSVTQSASIGLQFKKLDLHVHTPASEDFQGNVEPSDIVEEAIRHGLDGIAVTDHNTGDWIDRVKEAANGTGLTVFPGVEITCSGGERNIHIVALFDPSRDTEWVHSALSALDLTPDDLGKRDALVMKTPLEVIKIIQGEKWGGIAIPAHVYSESGILRDMRGDQRTNTVRHPALLAVEATDFQNEDKKDKRKRVVDLLDGSDPVYQRKLAVYQSSDNPSLGDGHGHALDGIGTRCSHFKLEHINLDGLRQCFADPDVRIRHDFEFETWQYPRIKQVAISGGFLDGQIVELHTGLNSILGGKGAGKSVLIELLRFGLGQPPDHFDILTDHLGKLGARLGEYGFVEIVFVDETGKDLTVKRVFDPIEESPFEDIPYNPAQVMPVLFLSQNEIIKISEDEGEQLTFIDRFFDFRKYKTEIQALEADLATLDKKMAQGLRAFPVVRQLHTEIASLNEEIDRLDEALKDPLFEQYRTAEQKNLVFESQTKLVQSLNEISETTRDQAADVEVPELPEELRDDPALRRNQDTLNRAHRAFEEQLNTLTTALSKHRDKVDGEREKWLPQYERTKQEYDEYVQKSGGDYKSLALERARKVKRLEELKQRLAAQQQKKESVTDISTQREELLDRLEEIYRRYTEERQAKCDQFQDDSDGRLQLNILGSSNVEEFRQQLLNLKQGSYLRENEIESICSGVTPREFILALLRYASTEGRQPKPLKEVAGKAKLSDDRMRKLADFLIEGKEYEELLALQYRAVPQDRPEILYNIGDDTYFPLNEVSVGQKSIALLLMALSEGKMPIVIDQPEDSLDIRTIWEDICLKLRVGKEQRQFILTTHSSSVAVASDTDYFIILEGTATEGRVVFSGSMDHEPVSEEVLTYLEGGLDAYGRKFMKYRAGEKLGRAR